MLAEISAVCDISTDEERLVQNDQRVCEMQRRILEPLEQLLQAAEVGSGFSVTYIMNKSRYRELV